MNCVIAFKLQRRIAPSRGSLSKPDCMEPNPLHTAAALAEVVNQLDGLYRSQLQRREEHIARVKDLSGQHQHQHFKASLS